MGKLSVRQRRRVQRPSGQLNERIVAISGSRGTNFA